jgi:hypothetical protein
MIYQARIQIQISNMVEGWQELLALFRVIHFLSVSGFHLKFQNSDLYNRIYRWKSNFLPVTLNAHG